MIDHERLSHGCVNGPYRTGHVRLCAAVEAMRVAFQGMEDDFFVCRFLFVERLKCGDAFIKAHALCLLLDFRKFKTECINCKGDVDWNEG